MKVLADTNFVMDALTSEETTEKRLFLGKVTRSVRIIRKAEAVAKFALEVYG